MRLVVIDAVPALLTWEGRDASGPADIDTDVRLALEHLAVHHRLAAIADGSVTGQALRRSLENADCDMAFESVSTSAASGPIVNARVIRRLARTLGTPIDAVTVVTARPELATGLRAARISVIQISGPHELDGVTAEIEQLFGGPLSP